MVTNIFNRVRNRKSFFFSSADNRINGLKTKERLQWFLGKKIRK